VFVEVQAAAALGAMAFRTVALCSISATSATVTIPRAACRTEAGAALVAMV
jgi:hypothetical protein